MGTYGVTHIKKDDKIIPFSDSYDGYWSGMGQANLIGLKYISLGKLAQLFDSFTARKALSYKEIESFEEDFDDDDEETSLSHREIQNFISQVSNENENNPEALAWANDIVQGDIRTSSVGVVPLLYMNIHPHYGQNYDSADYLIDLDNKVFVFSNVGLEIPLELIQKTSILHLNYFFENDFSLLDSTKYSEFSEDGIEYYLYDLEDETDKINGLKKVQQFVSDIFSISDDKIQSYFDKKELERQQWLANNAPSTTSHHVEEEEQDEDSYSYSLYTADVSADRLRKIIFFLQEKAKQPGYEFLLDCSEWGLEETYIHGGIRLKSPQSTIEQSKFEEVMLVLEYSFKQGFNIMSGAGFGFASDFDKEKNLTLQKSIYSFEELKGILTSEDFNVVMNECLPYLAYHSYLNEATQHIIDQKGKTNSPIFWTFVSLLSQNTELFKVIYPFALKQLATLNQEDKTRVENIYLSSYYDGEQLSQVLGKNSDFQIDLRATTFFEDCSAVLNDTEKQEFLC